MAAPYKVLSVVGARPNFMKVAPIVAQLQKEPHLFTSLLVHTGQHYDEKLSKVFFEDLGIPQPDVNLSVGSGSQAQQTAAIMSSMRSLCVYRRGGSVSQRS